MEEMTVSSNKQLTFLMLFGGFFIVPLISVLVTGRTGLAWFPIAGFIISMVYLVTDGE